mmetsp:Transcript_18417/g.63924  ORF Transcript_18417/g.63924 Transcript_18417/m.63924 type:complete len:235 (+) Transcript_18417:457-1161(+)
MASMMPMDHFSPAVMNAVSSAISQTTTAKIRHVWNRARVSNSTHPKAQATDTSAAITELRTMFASSDVMTSSSDAMIGFDTPSGRASPRSSRKSRHFLKSLDRSATSESSRSASVKRSRSHATSPVSQSKPTQWSMDAPSKRTRLLAKVLRWRSKSRGDSGRAIPRGSRNSDSKISRTQTVFRARTRSESVALARRQVSNTNAWTSRSARSKDRYLGLPPRCRDVALPGRFARP